MKLNDDMLAILFREFLAPASHRFEPLPVGDEELRAAVEEFREHVRELADPGREHLIDDDRRFLAVYKRLEAE